MIIAGGYRQRVRNRSWHGRLSGSVRAEGDHLVGNPHLEENGRAQTHRPGGARRLQLIPARISAGNVGQNERARHRPRERLSVPIPAPGLGRQGACSRQRNPLADPNLVRPSESGPEERCVVHRKRDCRAGRNGDTAGFDHHIVAAGIARGPREETVSRRGGAGDRRACTPPLVRERRIARRRDREHHAAPHVCSLRNRLQRDDGVCNHGQCRHRARHRALAIDHLNRVGRSIRRLGGCEGQRGQRRAGHRDAVLFPLVGGRWSARRHHGQAGHRTGDHGQRLRLRRDSRWSRDRQKSAATGDVADGVGHLNCIGSGVRQGRCRQA